MKPGRKALPAEIKRAHGTWRRDRDGDKIALTPADSPPLTPDGLSARALDIWEQNLGRVMAAGVGEADSDLFATYCELQGAVRAAWRMGEAPPISALAELRRLAELLGLAGPRSRVARAATHKDNPFARLHEKQNQSEKDETDR